MNKRLTLLGLLTLAGPLSAQTIPLLNEEYVFPDVACKLDAHVRGG